MKSIKIVAMVLICKVCCGQEVVHTESIADLMVAEQKGAINALLAYETRLLNRQRDLMFQLSTAENIYQNKIGPLSNISNSMVYTAVQTAILTLDGRIRDIEHNIRLRKYETFGIRHGLRGHEAGLKRQKAYFEALKKENAILLSHAAVSGGAGYNYTAFLKLLLRVMKIRDNIFQIDRDVKSLMSASYLLAR